MAQFIKKTLGIGASAALPAVAFFTDMAPPMVPSLALIVAALAGYWSGWADIKADPPEVRAKRSRRALSGALLLIAAYAASFSFTTVRDEATIGGKTTRTERVQTGFGMASWSMRRDASGNIPTRPPSPLEALREAGVSQSGAFAIWSAWSIYTASTLLIILFLASGSLWAHCFALLRPPPPPK